MSKVRLVFMGTPQFAVTCLEALLNDDHYEIAGVLTQPDRPSGRKMVLTPSPVKVLAQKFNLPVFTPEKASKDEVIETIKTLKAECAVVVAYGQILSQKFIDMFPFGAVNVHASLLPLWRGAAPIQRSIEAGDTETGVALQRVVKELDAGDVLGIRKIKIENDWSALTLHDKLADLSKELLHVELMDYIRGNLVPIPQDHSKMTYAKKILKSESKIDWSKSAAEIHNKVRGLQMGPGTWTQVGKVSVGPGASAAGAGPASVGATQTKLKIHKTMAFDSADAAQVFQQLKLEKIATLPAVAAYKIGKVIISSGRLFVATGNGFIEILEIQPESRQKLKTVEFLKSNAISHGDELE